MRIYFVFLLLFAVQCLNAQAYVCRFLITQKKVSKKIISTSRDPIILPIDTTLTAELIFTNLGKQNTLSAELSLIDKSGFLPTLGSILEIQFNDGTHEEVIASSKKLFSSVAFFNLLKPTKKSAKKVMAFEDENLYLKLTQTGISSFVYLADGKKLIMRMSTDQTEMQKRLVSCIVVRQ